ncbi:AsnC family transcriptional regulator [Gordonia sp. HNM0687]|uniref:AsnC family transcriptional regulator n=1 Tax=Gordonia mangrovi TaxID=2665643 RepID=A0A6L7GX25_9ACTN|nr:Lrp/AsnC family transcriptional regulator [Gordonia mangrovi]MXP23078.1 AsnC family transcriptional regulator [Gordonia mangrovi]UVF77365.1 Lrp/AsnC family transcriptional regulator [Gordonia mangrovi]
MSEPATTTTLDGTAKQIIEELQADGRASYASIGKAVGLSEAAVRNRVQKLGDSGLLQIVAVTDPLKLGFSRQALIGIRCTGNTEALAEQLAICAEIDYVVLTAGSFDILIEVVCEDDDHLLRILNHNVRTHPEVTATETLVYLKLVKQQYNWGTR